jgi:hypothetical protein
MKKFKSHFTPLSSGAKYRITTRSSEATSRCRLNFVSSAGKPKAK